MGYRLCVLYIKKKRDDYGDFKKVEMIIKEKGHITSEGLEGIRQIKARMNRDRSFS